MHNADLTFTFGQTQPTNFGGIKEIFDRLFPALKNAAEEPQATFGAIFTKTGNYACNGVIVITLGDNEAKIPFQITEGPLNFVAAAHQFPLNMGAYRQIAEALLANPVYLPAQKVAEPEPKTRVSELQMSH